MLFHLPDKFFFLHTCNIVIYKKYTFGRCPHFLAHSSQHTWNFLCGKSNRTIILVIIFGLLSSGPENCTRAITVTWISVILKKNKKQEHPFPSQLGLCSWGDFWKVLKDGSWLLEEQTMWSEVWNLQPYPQAPWTEEGLEIESSHP